MLARTRAHAIHTLSTLVLPLCYVALYPCHGISASFPTSALYSWYSISVLRALFSPLLSSTYEFCS